MIVESGNIYKTRSGNLIKIRQNTKFVDDKFPFFGDLVNGQGNKKFLGEREWCYTEKGKVFINIVHPMDLVEEIIVNPEKLQINTSEW